MSISSGPKVIKDSILVDLDAANFKETPSISITNTVNPFTVNYTVYNNPGFVVTSTRTNELFKGVPVYRVTYSPQGVSMVPRLGSTEGFGFYHGMGINLLPNTPYMSSVYFRTNYPVNTTTWSNTYSNIGGWGHSSTGTTRYQEGKWIRMYTRFLNNIVIQGVSYATRDTYSSANVTVNTTAQTDVLITLTFNANRTVTIASPLSSSTIGLSEGGTMVGFRSISPIINSSTVSGLATGSSAIVNHGLNTDTWTKITDANPIYHANFPINYFILVRVPSTSGVNQTINIRPTIFAFNTSISDQKFWKITFNTSNLAVNDVIETFWAAPMIEQTDRLYPSPYVIGTESRNFFTSTTWPDLSGNSNNGTLTNGPVYNSGNNGYFFFDGTDDYLTTPAVFNGQSINYWTTSFWIYPSTGGWLISPASGGFDHYVSYDSTNKRIGVSVIPIQDTTTYSLNSTINSVPLNTWTNITISINNLDIKIYINGVLDASGTATANHDEPWTGTWRWCQRGTGQFSMQARLANIKIYNDILTADEVKQNFESFRKRFNI